MMPQATNRSATSALHRHGDHEGRGGQRPLERALHPEFGESVAGVQDQGDDRRAYPVEDGLHRGQAAPVDVERPEHGNDHEVRQDERPVARPGAPEAAPDVRDPDADLDREWPGQRLADRDALAHLFLGQPLSLAHQLALQLADQGHGTAEADQAEAQVIPHQLADGDALPRRPRVHGDLRDDVAGSVTFDLTSIKRYVENR